MRRAGTTSPVVLRPEEKGGRFLSALSGGLHPFPAWKTDAG